MIGFIIKKAFFDAWDNLFKLVVFNFMTIPFLVLVMLGLKVLAAGSILGIVLVVLGIIGIVIHQGTIAYFLRDIGNSISISISDYFKYLKEDFKVKVQFAVSWALFITITTFSIFYYFNGEGMMSLIPLALVFWFSTITTISILLFFPIKVRLGGSFKKVLKKSFILLLDNPLTGIFVFIYGIILFILSVPTLGLLPPGASSISCLLDTVVHLYELKYDYLENNPDVNRKKIPWAELTYELNENIGPRTLRGMLFPWKN